MKLNIERNRERNGFVSSLLLVIGLLLLFLGVPAKDELETLCYILGGILGGIGLFWAITAAGNDSYSLNFFEKDDTYNN